MNSKQEFAECTGKLVAKVLIMGKNPALLAGILRQISGRELSYKLYSSLGIGLGVARRAVHETTEVVMQLWSLPIDERVLGINASMSRGARGIILVLEELSAQKIESILSWLNHTKLHSINVVIMGGELPQIEDLMETVSKWNLTMGEVRKVDGLYSIMDEIAVSLHSNRLGPKSIRFSVLDKSTVVPYEPQPRIDSIPICNQEELIHLQEFAQDNGFDLKNAEAMIEINEGTIRIDLVTGEIRLSPRICNHCIRDCKRQSRICIIERDKGWTSENLGRRALMILSKLHAFSSKQYPRDVQNQIAYASNCASYRETSRKHINSRKQQDALDIEEDKTSNLLDVAKQRVKEKSLSSTAYRILKDWFDKFG